jgi:hypothetical protein
MHLGNKIFKVLLSSEILVEGVKVLSPVSVIPVLSVFDDWRDPNSVKAHFLNVVKMINEIPICSATVEMEV